ncbi:PHD finger protein 10, partial [Quaeritorhiza haematococci]
MTQADDADADGTEEMRRSSKRTRTPRKLYGKPEEEVAAAENGAKEEEAEEDEDQDNAGEAVGEGTPARKRRRVGKSPEDAPKKPGRKSSPTKGGGKGRGKAKPGDSEVAEESEEDHAGDEEEEEEEQSGTAKKSRRPRRSVRQVVKEEADGEESEQENEDAGSTTAEVEKPKRPRGRPRTKPRPGETMPTQPASATKTPSGNPLVLPSTDGALAQSPSKQGSSEAQPSPPAKRRPGRPRKYPRAEDGTPIKPPPEGQPEEEASTVDGDELGEDPEKSWDPKGEEKISKDGWLQGGRQYKCRTFILPRHQSKQYMLTMDVSKILGFRDSYIFFMRNPNFNRIYANDQDREYLIKSGMVPGQLKNRNVSLVTARSIFRAFGHKIIRRGRPVRDDYWVGDRKEEDYPYDEYAASDEENMPTYPYPLQAEDQLAMLRDYAPNAGAGYGQSITMFPMMQRSLSSGGGGYYRPEQQNITPFFTRTPSAPLDPKDVGSYPLANYLSKRDSAMWRCASSAAVYNSRLRADRRGTFYDPHTNIEQVPKESQPSRVYVEVEAGTFGDPDIPATVDPAVFSMDNALQRGGAAALESSMIMAPQAPPSAPSPPGQNVNLYQHDPWVAIGLNADLSDYPLSIMPGQFQEVFSIFTPADAAAAAAAQAAANRAAMGHMETAPGRDASESPEANGGKGAATFMGDSSAVGSERGTPQPSGPANNVVVLLPDGGEKNQQFICGEVTKLGTLCRRPVGAAGDKCSRHEKSTGTGALNPLLCCHCNAAIPPAKKKTEKSIEDNNNDNEDNEDEEGKISIPPNVLLICSQCRLRHHPKCVDLDDPVLISKIQTYQWHCPNCKMCTICNEAGDEAKMLFCDTCDRGYHMYCLQPPLTKLPEGEWLCSQCAVCTSCGKRATSSGTALKRTGASSSEGEKIEWNHAVAPSPDKNSLATYVCTYCSTCYSQFQTDRFCPLCMRVYTEDSDDLAMVCCDSCDRWIHVGCDPELSNDMYQQLVEEPDSKYTCILCDAPKLSNYLAKKNAEEIAAANAFNAAANAAA